MKTSKDNFRVIFFILAFIGIDTFCLFFYAEQIGLSLPLAILLSILIAAILDILSYISSFYGAGKWLSIPAINLPEILKDKKKAIIISITAVFTTVCFQVGLVSIRHNQIIDKTEKYNSSTEIYIDTVKENNFQSERARQIYIQDRPAYDGNIIMDWLSIIVPIATTILSFIIGMVSVKEYDHFENRAEEKHRELLKKQEELLKKQTEFDKFLGQADSKINTIQAAAKISNLKELILSDISEKNKDALGVFILKLESNLRSGAPKLYAKHIENLKAALLVKAEEIKTELSRNANNPSIVKGIDLESDFKKEIEQLIKLENILDKKLEG